MLDPQHLKATLTSWGEAFVRFLIFLMLVFVFVFPPFAGVTVCLMWGAQFVPDPYRPVYFGFVVLMTFLAFTVGRKFIDWCAVNVLGIQPRSNMQGGQP